MFVMPQPQRFTGNPSIAMLRCSNPDSIEIQRQRFACNPPTAIRRLEPSARRPSLSWQLSDTGRE
jgi:hypothetical protein